MSTQYTNKTYCSTSQSTSYWKIPLSLTQNIDQNELITKEVYDQMFASLKAIHDFGDYDSATSRLPNVNDKLELISEENYIDIDCYNDSAKRIGLSEKAKKDEIIYGSYFSDLQKSIQEYKLPGTRYYKQSYECCDHCDHCDHSSHRPGGGCGSCNMCMDSFDNGCSSGQGGACGCYANGTMR